MNQLQDPKLREFLAYCREIIKYKGKTKIRLYDDHEVSKAMKSMATFFPETNEIWVLRGQRIRADWYRSLAHELVHLKQREEGFVLDGTDGSDHENGANSLAAVILREWGRRDPEIYSLSGNLITEKHKMEIHSVRKMIDSSMIEEGLSQAMEYKNNKELKSIDESFFTNLDVYSENEAIVRGMVKFDPDDRDTWPKHIKLISWIKDDTNFIQSKLEERDYKACLWYANEIRTLAEDLVKGMEEAYKESTKLIGNNYD